jgi:DNA-binding HxlR family transcriptional regulator
MKSQKISESAKKWYGDACGTAHALELVGERWALLVVRELMFGPRRFGELRAGLPGISANVLTQRLEGLEGAGIVMRHKLPPPASVQVYELTPWGYESEPIIQMLGRWAARSPGHDPTLPLSAASLMLSFRTMISADRADGMKARIGFRFGADSFVARLRKGRIDIARGEAEQPDFAIASDPMTVASIVYGGRPIADAEAAGVLTFEGDRALAARFATLFPLPAKIGLPKIG